MSDIYNEPAFPVHPGVSFTDGSAPNYGGMSLRDYFAATALQGLIAAGAGASISRAIGKNIEDKAELTKAVDLALANSAFSVADAMLAERIKATS